MENNIYDKIELSLIQELLGSEFILKKHLKQYKLNGKIMVDDFLVQKGSQEHTVTMNFDGELLAIDNKFFE